MGIRNEPESTLAVNKALNIDVQHVCPTPTLEITPVSVYMYVQSHIE